MAFTDGTAVRSDDTEGVLKTFRLKEKGGEVYQVVLPADADGAWDHTDGTLLNKTLTKASAGTVYEIHCTHSNATDRYLCIVDKATAIADADVPSVRVFLPASGSATIHFPAGLDLASGIAICVSDTLATVTLPADSSTAFSVRFE